MSAPPPPRPDKVQQGQAQPESPTRTVTTEELLGAARELLIVHAGKQYRLRITRNGRLILNT